MTTSGTINYDIYEVDYNYSYDAGVRYHSDGSGTPPDESLEILKVTTTDEDDNVIEVDYDSLDLKTQNSIDEKCIDDANNQ